MQVRQNHCNF